LWEEIETAKAFTIGQFLANYPDDLGVNLQRLLLQLRETQSVFHRRVQRNASNRHDAGQPSRLRGTLAIPG
jgi:hypothetical protein